MAAEGDHLELLANLIGRQISLSHLRVGVMSRFQPWQNSAWPSALALSAAQDRRHSPLQPGRSMTATSLAHHHALDMWRF